MTDRYLQENNELMENMLKNTYFASWGEKGKNDCSEKYLNYKSLELIINGYCDLKCKYCYITNFGEQLYPREIHQNTKNIVQNTKIFLDWMRENNLYTHDISLFSGDPLVQNIGYEILDLVIDFLSVKGGTITIPTNFNFCLDEKRLEEVRKRIKICEEKNIKLFLSASVDGLYCDKNRPFKNSKKERDYDKIFLTAKEFNAAFHPMIYSEEIEYWKDNFLWFQEMFQKYDMPWDILYLLEVRNVEWNQKQIKEFYKFIQFVVEWCYNTYKYFQTPTNFLNYAFEERLFNLFGLFSKIGRGVGCSIQNSFQLRLADLSIFPCHRLTYPYFKLMEFEKKNDKIIGIKGISPELWSAVQVMNHKKVSYCETCIIKELCTGQCLGSMFEVTNDMFTPIPVVCQLEHVKSSAIINKLYDLGIFPNELDYLPAEKRQSVEMLRNCINTKEIRI